RHVFVKLYNKGLIYRGSRIINWCPCCKTAISDAEVEFSEKEGHFWHIRYPAADGGEGVIIATTRPETLLGDTAVAVNPKDKRYKDLVGKTLILPLTGREIPVVADDYVDMEFGTGAVKITPAHDPNDFEVGLRHELPVIRVMDDGGVINELGGKYQGLDRYEARKQIVEDLKALGLLVKIEPHVHNVGECYRCHTVIEPIVSKQWFVKMKPLAEPAIATVKNKEIKFIPKRFEKIYFNWMNNIRDWCISRQLWWGHRIPAWYCDKCGKMTVSETDITVCPHCGGALRQDEDVLDTWFSSALWPFSTLGYPDKTEDLEYFYPTDVLVTAYDIIFFWVARMIFSGLEHMQEIPFKDILITGLVRDEQGRKMSKSLGNGIDPLEIIDRYGADTLRFSLLNGVAPGSDTRFSERKVEGCRNFVNKLWNASRFVLLNCEGHEIKPLSEVKLSLADRWILKRMNDVVRTVTRNMEKYELGLATAAVYDFMWTEFCDWYIEMAKPMLYGVDEQKRSDTLSVLVHVLKVTLQLLHPFVPFVTEEIWKNVPTAEGSIMMSTFPVYDKKLNYAKHAKTMSQMMDLIRSIRNVRAELGVVPSKRTKLFIAAGANKRAVSSCSLYLEKLASASELIFVESKEQIGEETMSVTSPLCDVYLALGELVDRQKEIERLTEELAHAQAEIDRAEKMLANKGFTDKAPKAVVDTTREKLEMQQKLAAQIREKLAFFNK
ncbi:MAG: valine--tRNA ligase, partial [Clostridia bacterium]|nr:valine--tRNA ligase [Clostridia bacterium]